jgi:NAD(P)-dependent dehydrogenase (short-subunit alcohol dehydrogenase family)
MKTHDRSIQALLRGLLSRRRAAPIAVTLAALASGVAVTALVAAGTAATGTAQPHVAHVPEATMPQPVGQERQVVLITGSTDGLGREVARRVAATGAHVIVHGRNRERGEALVKEIEAEGKGSAAFYAADFASLDQVRQFAASVMRDHDRLDVLVNNAGIWARGDNERRLSEDGHELQFAVNYLSGYLLTRTLLPLILESAPARIINVASTAQQPIDFDDVMMERGYTGGRGYAQSKLAQILFTFDLAAELERAGVTGVAPRSTIDQGASAVMRLITDPALAP